MPPSRVLSFLLRPVLVIAAIALLLCFYARHARAIHPAEVPPPEKRIVNFAQASSRNDPPQQADATFKVIASLDASNDDNDRNGIKTDVFGDIYVSMDGSDIALGKPGAIYAQTPPFWIAAAGEKVFEALPRDGRLVVKQSVDGGQTFPTEALIASGFRNSSARAQSNLVLEQKAPEELELLNVYLGLSGNELYFANCIDPCNRFSSQLISAADNGKTFDHPFPSIAADSGGGIHVAFSDGENIWLLSSSDDGQTWRNPVRINEGLQSESDAFAPVVVAGDAGRLDVFWNQGSGLYYAESNDAFAATPVFHSEKLFSDSDAKSVAAAALEPSGFVTLSYRSGNRIVVARQTQGEPLTLDTLLSSIGHIPNDDGPKYLSYEIREDMTGQLNFWDSAARIWLRANRFQLQKQDDGRLTIEGSGILQNGTKVTFSILAPNHGDNSSDVSITLGNGYFVQGPFRPTEPSECKVHRVLEGGRITEN